MIIHCSSAVFGFRVGMWSAPTFGEVCVLLYLVIFSLYWLWAFLSLFYSVHAAREMQSFYTEHLDISDEQLTTLV